VTILDRPIAKRPRKWKVITFAKEFTKEQKVTFQKFVRKTTSDVVFELEQTGNESGRSYITDTVTTHVSPKTQ
jgi:hypothetical protein